VARRGKLPRQRDGASLAAVPHRCLRTHPDRGRRVSSNGWSLATGEVRDGCLARRTIDPRGIAGRRVPGRRAPSRARSVGRHGTTLVESLQARHLRSLFATSA
jgi:hypothetical protein